MFFGHIPRLRLKNAKDQLPLSTIFVICYSHFNLQSNGVSKSNPKYIDPKEICVDPNQTKILEFEVDPEY